MPPDTSDATGGVAPARHYALLRWLGHRQWLRYGIRERVLRAFCHPDRAPPVTFVSDFNGFRYPGDLRRLIDWIVFFYGAYERPELELMRELVRGRPAPVALDVGANVGHHSLYMAGFCGAVHAFEPYEGVRRLLDEKLALNAISNVTVHPVGLGAADATLEYFAPQGSNTGTGSFVAEHESRNNRAFGRLQVVEGDRYVDGLGLRHLDLVKIDVEGFELAVIAGLKRTLERHRPAVVMELSDTSRDGFRDHGAFMTQFPEGYRAEVIQSNLSRWGVFNRPACMLAPFDVASSAGRGGYVNLLLRDAGTPRRT